MAKPSPQFAGDPVLIALGAAIRRARTGGGLSQEALAVDAEVDRSYMGGIERGERIAVCPVRVSGALDCGRKLRLDKASLSSPPSL